MADYKGIIVTPDPIRKIDSATFTGAYQALGAKLTKPIRIMKFVNLSNVSVTISFDGATDHDIIPSEGFALYDFTSDKVQDDGYYVSAGTQIWIKGAAGVGSVFLVCFGA